MTAINRRHLTKYNFGIKKNRYYVVDRNLYMTWLTPLFKLNDLLRPY